MPIIFKTFSIIVVFCSPLLAVEENSKALASDEVVERISQGIRDCYMSFKLSTSPEREQIRQTALGGMSDAEKIRGLAEWMFRQDSHTSVADHAIQLLLSPKSEILDSTELRILLKKEDDSRRFYKLMGLSTYFVRKNHESFLAESARGLLMNGPAADIGQSTVRFPIKDIRANSYYSLVASVGISDSPFVLDVVPTLEGKPEEEKFLTLARWMKANWPGCEGLEIPGETVASPKRTAASLPGGRIQPADRPRPVEDGVAGTSEGSLKLGLICATSVLVLLALTTFILRRQPRS